MAATETASDGNSGTTKPLLLVTGGDQSATTAGTFDFRSLLRKTNLLNVNNVLKTTTTPTTTTLTTTTSRRTFLM